jgi:uncharacterized protein (DUF2141 family)
MRLASSDSRATRSGARQDGSIASRDAIERDAAVKQFIQYAVVAVLASASLAHAADMTIDVTGLKNAKGKVMVAVFDNADHFLKQPMRTGTVDAQTGTVHMLLAGLPPGDYAISLFHDQNGNGKLDKNPIGMPIEPYGFSNDAAGAYGPPTFQQSVTHLADTGSVVKVTLR